MPRLFQWRKSSQPASRIQSDSLTTLVDRSLDTFLPRPQAAAIKRASSPVADDKSEASEASTIEDSLQIRLERLGRQRPPIFETAWSEVFFVFSIVMSQFLTEYFVSGFVIILPTVVRELQIPEGNSVWPATAFSLVIASTLCIFGRLGDMWGAYAVFLGGLGWILVWSIVAGFSIDSLMLNFCRALQGLGAAAFLPTGVQLMGSLYRPGPRKNLVFAIYGTSAVVGFFGGIFIAGIVGEYLNWGWYFWIGAMLAAITLSASVFSIPRSQQEHSSKVKIKMDYLGAITIVSGLVLTIFAITQAAHAPSGWRTPYIPVCFTFGLLCLLLAGYIETCVSDQPLLPPAIFTTSAMAPLLLGVFLLYGTWGIYSVYGTFYFQEIMGASPLQVVAWNTPVAITGIVMSVLEGLMLHLVPGRVLLIMSGLAALVSQLLLALMPLESASYWAWIFPSTILSSVGIDVSTILMTVFTTSTFPSSQQGLAGGIVNSVLQLGIAFCLGVTDNIQTATVIDVGLARSYKNTFWFGVAAGATGLVVMAIWGKVPKGASDLTADEKEELLRAAQQEKQARLSGDSDAC